MNPTGIRIIILNYHGRDLLPQCLPSILRAASNAPRRTMTAIVQNPGGDSGLDYVRQSYPEVAIWEAPVNRVLCSFNDYLPLVDEEIVVLLNNDIRVDENFLAPLIRKFDDDPLTFLAAPRVMSFDGLEIQAARAKSGFRFGSFWCDARYPGYLDEAMTPSTTDSSGFGAFSRKKFLELGGYDDRFFPGIMEDVDLCYRAKKAGYRLFYEPASVVYHLGQANFKRTFGEERVRRIAHRNNFLFMWKNFKSLEFWIFHLTLLPVRLGNAAVKGDWTLFAGLKDALVIQWKK